MNPKYQASTLAAAYGSKASESGHCSGDTVVLGDSDTDSDVETSPSTSVKQNFWRGLPVVLLWRAYQFAFR